MSNIELKLVELNDCDYVQLLNAHSKKEDRFSIAVSMERLDILLRLIKDGYTWNEDPCVHGEDCYLKTLDWLRDSSISEGRISERSDGSKCHWNVEVCMYYAHLNNMYKNG
mgnify:CR=1 FL=1